MLKSVLPILGSFLLVACSGMNPVTDGGGAPGEAPISTQMTPGFPAGNPGPDVTPEDKKFQFFIYPKMEEYQQLKVLGQLNMVVKGVRFSGTLQCPVTEKASPCQEGLVLRVVDMSGAKFVETKIAAASKAGHYSFQVDFPESSISAGANSYEYWVFYLNGDAAAAGGSVSVPTECPKSDVAQGGLACIAPGQEGSWGIGYPLEGEAN